MRPRAFFSLALRLLSIPLLASVLSLNAHASWQPDKQVSFTPGGSGLSQSNAKSVAFDPLGGVHVVWHDDTPGNYELFYLGFDSLTTFPAEPRRLTNNTGASRNASLALLDDTTAFVVWSEETGSLVPIINFLQFGPGTYGLLDSGSVSTEPTACSNPAVAAGPDTSAHVVWTQKTGQVFNIFYRKWHHGWEASPQNISPSPGLCLTPCVALDGMGNVHVAWSDNITGNYEIFYCRYVDGAGWEPAFRVSESNKLAWTPTISADRNGNVYVVWADRRDGYYDIYFRRYLYDVGWGSEKRLTINMSVSAKPSAAVDCDGNLHVVWEDFRDGNDEIYYKKVTNSDGPGWDPVDTRLTENGATSWDASVAAGCDGNVHVVWADARTGNFEIFYKLGIRPVPVGVDLLSFHAECLATGVVLKWEVASDSPLAFFDIYREEEGGGALKKLTEMSLFDASEFLDVTAEPGKTYLYYLAVWEGQGDEEVMFGPISVRFEPPGVPGALRLAAWPNPTRGPLNIVFGSENSGTPYTLRLFDVSGRFLAEIASGRTTEGATKLVWNVFESVGRDLGAGVYFVCLDVGGTRAERKILISR